MNYRTNPLITSSSYYSIDDDDDSDLFNHQNEPPKKIRKPLLQQLNRYGLRRREPSSPLTSSSRHPNTNNTNMNVSKPLTRRRSRLRHSNAIRRIKKNNPQPTRKSHRLERNSSNRPSYHEIPPSSETESSLDEVPIFIDKNGNDNDNGNDDYRRNSLKTEIKEKEVLIAGMEDKKEEIREMVLFPLLYPEILLKLAINVPRGVLFHGPPGTGKTLLARYMAQSCKIDKKISFYYRNGSDLLSKWLGEGERKLRDLFQEAKENEPSIIFFDEIDGLAPSRSKMDSSSTTDQAHVSLVATLLALMDGLEDRGKVVVIGATNRISSLDSALRRPGRFDREFHFPLPSPQERSSIIRLLCSKFSLNNCNIDDVINYLLMRTISFSGADLSSLCSAAALNGLRRFIRSGGVDGVDVHKDIMVGLEDFEDALIKQAPSLSRCPPSYRESLMKPSKEWNISVKDDSLYSLFEGVFESIIGVLRNNSREEAVDGRYFVDNRLMLFISIDGNDLCVPTHNQMDFLISLLKKDLCKDAFVTIIDVTLLDRMEMMAEFKMMFEYLYSMMGDNYDDKIHYIIVPRWSLYLESSDIFKQFLKEIGGRAQKCLLFINCESPTFSDFVKKHFFEIDQFSFGTWVREMVLKEGGSSFSKEEQDRLIPSLIKEGKEGGGMEEILKRIILLGN